MPTWTRRESTHRRIEYLVPVPAAYAELCKAIAAAERAVRKARGHAPDASLADDELTVTVTDDAVVIAYTIDLNLPVAEAC
jgi:hypothetical protein